MTGEKDPTERERTEQLYRDAQIVAGSYGGEGLVNRDWYPRGFPAESEPQTQTPDEQTDTATETEQPNN